MILSCQNVEKAFLEKQVIKNCSFHIEEHEKAAIVGINGAGKTTLLRILVGELEADAGSVTFAKDATFGYLSQNAAVNTENTIYGELLSVKKHLLELEEQIRTVELLMNSAQGSELEAMMEKYADLTHAFESENGYAYKSELTGVLKGLGFAQEDFDRPVSTLSGGQKTRVALGRILLQNPDLIILDEPTNHLDMSSIAWLETYLLNYRGAVLIVSHDRYFLDKIASKIIEIDHTKVTVFSGNYSAYASKKELLRQAEWKAYANQQEEIRHQQEVIAKLKSFNREKSIKRAESREKMLSKIEVLDKPSEVRSDMKMELHPRILSGNDVLTAEHLANYVDFGRKGFLVTGIFDVNPALYGKKIRGIEVRPMEEMARFVRENNVDIAVLTVPKSAAVGVAGQLVKVGISAIWNFAHVDLDVPGEVKVENVHLSDSLIRLSYLLNRKGAQEEGGV